MLLRDPRPGSIKLQSSISGEPGNTGRTLTFEVKWGTPAPVFTASIRPSLAPFRPPRLEEFPTKPPVRTMLASLLLHLAAVLVVVCLLPLLPLAFPFNKVVVILPEIRSDHVIYLPTPYLPQLEDSGGAESGKAGLSGGHTGHHPKQVIRVARRSAVVKAVAEAKLPALPPAVPGSPVRCSWRPGRSRSASAWDCAGPAPTR